VGTVAFDQANHYQLVITQEQVEIWINNEIKYTINGSFGTKSYLAFRDYGLCFGPVTNSIDNVSITPLNTENGEFTGKKFDPDTGLVYFGGRYYDPEIGRFISPDPSKEGLNYYAYCHNNPLGMVDPDGKCPLFVITGAAGAIIGGGYGAYTSYMQTGHVDWGTVGKDALIGGAIGLTGGAAASLAASTTMGGLSLTLTASQTFAGFNALVQGGTAATLWGVSKDGINQGIKHFFEYGSQMGSRLTNIANNLGLNSNAFSLTKQGFRNFTNAAMNVVNNYQSLGGLMRDLGSGKVAYYYNNVVVIMYNGKLQTMMEAGLKYFNKMQ
jgi:RHS repeat-associated protein